MGNPLLTILFLYFFAFNHTSTAGQSTVTTQAVVKTASGPQYRLEYQIDLQKVPATYQQSVLTDIQSSVGRRLKAAGLTKAKVYLSDASSKDLLIELAGTKTELAKYEKAVGSSTDLEFEEMSADASSADSNPWQKTDLNSSHLTHAEVQCNQYNQPQISIDFDAAGAKIFEDLTGQNISKPLGIFIDGQLISAPTVQEKIAGGVAIITGTFTVENAKELAENLNAATAPLTMVKVTAI